MLHVRSRRFLPAEVPEHVHVTPEESLVDKDGKPLAKSKVCLPSGMCVRVCVCVGVCVFVCLCARVCVWASV